MQLALQRHPNLEHVSAHQQVRSTIHICVREGPASTRAEYARTASPSGSAQPAVEKKKSWPRALPSHSAPAPGGRLTIAATPPAASLPSAGNCSTSAIAPAAATGRPPITGAYAPNGVCHALPGGKGYGLRLLR